MNIGGLQKTSLLDYPGCISMIIWTNGCNLKCPFCYNKNLALGVEKTYPEEDVFSFLSKRKGMIDGVVITGGEPLIQKDIVSFAEKVKKQGYLLKIDTNGTLPEKIRELLDGKLVDYIAMDIKAPKSKYDQLSGIKVDASKIDESIDLIKNKAPDYEFRTTMVPGMLTKEDVLEIAEWIKGAKRYYLQQFRVNPPLISSKLEKIQPYAPSYLYEIADMVKPLVEKCTVRGV
ncbi:MAG: anaerobic ribonucleoside-triphosphate reductase activating protein [Candidatus Thermoplasmatota archaeon]